MTMEPTNLFQTIAAAQNNPPVDVVDLCSRLGIRVNFQWLDDDVSGSLARVGEDHFEINVNALHPETRQRFTIAHELGHFVHHRSLLGEGVNDSKAYRVTPTAPHYNPRIGPRQETEANQFAASLLMPRSVVDRMRAEGMSVKDMAKALRVSQHAMSIRAGVPYPVTA